MFNSYSTDEEIALSNIQGIIVQDSIIYIGIGPSTNRIQEYSTGGNFIKNMHINGGNKKYTFTINEYGYPKIHKQSLDAKKNFQKTKELLSSETYKLIADINNVNQLDNPFMFISPEGTTYKFINHPLRNQLTSTDKDGLTKVIISQNFYFKLHHFGYSHFVYFFTILFLIVINAKQLGESMKNGKFDFWLFFQKLFK